MRLKRNMHDCISMSHFGRLAHTVSHSPATVRLYTTLKDMERPDWHYWNDGQPQDRSQNMQYQIANEVEDRGSGLA